MILRSVALRNWKGIRHARFEGLSERLTLLHGPNESGKSTLVEALRFGLFESPRGSGAHKRALRSWGGSDAPEIDVEFVDDLGEEWLVEKRFLDRPTTRLSGVNRVLSDKGAEAELRRIFGTRVPARGGMSDEILGIWPLLWVQQGRSGLPTAQALTADARSTLRDTLSARTGVAAVGAVGQAVLEGARARSAIWWTASGNPRKSLSDPRAALEAARTRYDEARERYLAAQEEIGRLEDTRRGHSSLERRVATQQTLVDAARSRAEAAASAEAAVEDLRREVALAELSRTSAAEQLATRRALDAEADAVEAALARQDPKVEAARRRLAERRDTRIARQADVEAAETHTLQARHGFLAAQRQEKRASTRIRLARLEELVARVETLTTQRAELAAALQANPATGVAYRQLEEALKDLDRAETRLEAASVRVTVHAEVDLDLDGTPVPAGTSRDVAVLGTTTLELTGVAGIRVAIGSGSLHDLRQNHATTQQTVQHLLVSLGVFDADDARTLHEERVAATQERAGIDRELAALAPEGVPALQAHVTADRELDRRLGPDDLGAGSVETSQEGLAEAMERLTTLRAERDGLDAPIEEATSLVHAEEGLRRELRSKRTAIARQLSALPSLAELERDDASAQGQLDASTTALEAGLAAWADAGGDRAAEAAELELRALAGLSERLEEARIRVIALTTAITERREDGLYEQLQDAEHALHLAQQARDHAERQAAASKRLVEALLESWHETRDRFATPVRQAVADGVRILFPGSELAMDDDGEVVGLRTGDTVERFEQLSGGAREQFGVLVRLGLAQVLAGDRRLPVILDDALVNSDPVRRGRMVELLRRAADGLQVLVFTCHEEDFDRLAAERRIEVSGRAPRGR